MVLATQRGRVGTEKNQHLLRAVDLPADLPEECVGWENTTVGYMHYCVLVRT